jgi:hypothetical protein
MEVRGTSPLLVLTQASKRRSKSYKLFWENNAAVRIALPVFCHGCKEKWGSGRTAGWDGEKLAKMLVLWLWINKSPKAKQVSNIHRIATAYRRRRRRHRHFLLTNVPLGATTARSVKRPGCGLGDEKNRRATEDKNNKSSVLHSARTGSSVYSSSE